LSQGVVLSAFWQKLIGNTRQILENDIPKLGDSWVTALFLAGLLMGFRNPSLKRLRYFLVSCLAVLTIVQALGRTQLSDNSPEINSENLLVLVAPVALMYGVSYFSFYSTRSRCLFRSCVMSRLRSSAWPLASP